MQRLGILVLILLSMALGSRVYSGGCEEVYVPRQQGCGNIGFEVVLLRPSTAVDAYTIFGPEQVPLSTPFGELREVDPNYQAGGRVFGNWDWCTRWDFAAEYTYLDERHGDQTIAGPNQGVWVILGQPIINLSELVGGAAVARLDVNYQEALLDVGRRVNVGSCFQLRMAAGVRFDRFSEQLDVTYRGMNGSEQVFNREKSSIWGIGPAFSAGAKYDICKGLYLNARARGALLTGEQNGRIAIENLAVSAQASNLGFEPTLEIFGVWDGRLGIGYCCRCGKGTITIEIGYETVILMEALKRWSYVAQSSPGQGVLDTHDVRLNGAYWRTSFGF